MDKTWGQGQVQRRGIELSTSTLADQVGYGTGALLPIFDLIETHVFAAERLFGDDTTIPIQAKDKCTTGRIWTYVRDDRSYGGAAAPAAIYYASSDRRGEHAQKHLTEYGGILQSDCYNGFEPLSVAEKSCEADPSLPNRSPSRHNVRYAASAIAAPKRHRRSCPHRSP
ncbi:hypothetical protein ILFOPFJJ_06545 [Ensifer psoraleae]|nr:hypothetical protein [Sinorhizobium psoraleae]